MVELASLVVILTLFWTSFCTNHISWATWSHARNNTSARGAMAGLVQPERRQPEAAVVNWGTFLLLRHEQRRGLSPGRRRARHVPASVPYHQCRSLLIACRLLNNLNQAWGRWPLQVVSAMGRKQRAAARVRSCITYTPLGSNQVACLHIHVSGFDPQQTRSSNSFVSLSWQLKCSDVGECLWSGSSPLLCMTYSTRHSLRRRSGFMVVLSHLIVTLMEAEARNASP